MMFYAILSPTDTPVSPTQRKMSSADNEDDDDEYPEEFSYLQALPVEPPTRDRQRRESQGDLGVLAPSVLELNHRMPPSRTSQGDVEIHPPSGGAAAAAASSPRSDSSQQQDSRPSRKISQGDSKVNYSEMASSSWSSPSPPPPADSRPFPTSRRTSQGDVELELAGSISHTHTPSYHQLLVVRTRISVGDVQLQQAESLLSSHRVTFSTVHVRTHKIEYDHAQYDKEYPLSLGWEILGEDYFALGHDDDDDHDIVNVNNDNEVVKPETGGPKKLSIQKRRKRLLGMGYTEMYLSEAETERGKVQSNMPPNDISLAEPMRITRPTADSDDEADTSTSASISASASTSSALGRRIGAAARYREQITRPTTDSDDEEDSSIRVKRSVGATATTTTAMPMGPERITRPTPDLDDEVDGAVALTVTRKKMPLEPERITRPTPDTDDDC